MSFKSKYFYVEITGDSALFTAPETKGGGEKYSYPVPTRQALQGIVDGIYWKPVLMNVIDEVRIMNPIETVVRGSRLLKSNYESDLNYLSYLHNVKYLVKYHFEWNMDRDDLSNDRNIMKHQEIMDRSLKKGGRFDIFLGVRECVGYIRKVSEFEYDNMSGKYDNQNLSFGIMFHSFKYPKDKNGKLIAYYTVTNMLNGKIIFKSQEECEMKNELSNYSFKKSIIYKNVDEEYEEYLKFNE